MRKMNPWVEAAIAFGTDINSEIPCPECGKGALTIIDTFNVEWAERYIICKICNAYNVASTSRSLEPAPINDNLFENTDDIIFIHFNHMYKENRFIYSVNHVLNSTEYRYCAKQIKGFYKYEYKSDSEIIFENPGEKKTIDKKLCLSNVEKACEKYLTKHPDKKEEVEKILKNAKLK